MQLRSGHVILLRTEFQPLNCFQLDLRHRAASRWALPHISSWSLFFPIFCSLCIFELGAHMGQLVRQYLYCNLLGWLHDGAQWCSACCYYWIFTLLGCLCLLVCLQSFICAVCCELVQGSLYITVSSCWVVTWCSVYSTTALFDELGLLVFVHGAMYMAFAALEEPQSIRSIGLHQTVGDCNATTAVHTPLGQVCTTRCLSVCLLALLHFSCYWGRLSQI